MKKIACIIVLLFVGCLWAAAIITNKKKNRKLSLGQKLNCIGVTIISVGLILNGFEIISHDTLVITNVIGIAVEVVALITILIQKEF